MGSKRGKKRQIGQRSVAISPFFTLCKTNAAAKVSVSRTKRKRERKRKRKKVGQRRRSDPKEESRSFRCIRTIEHKEKFPNGSITIFCVFFSAFAYLREQNSIQYANAKCALPKIKTISSSTSQL